MPGRGEGWLLGIHLRTLRTLYVDQVGTVGTGRGGHNTRNADRDPQTEQMTSRRWPRRTAQETTLLHCLARVNAGGGRGVIDEVIGPSGYHWHAVNIENGQNSLSHSHSSCVSGSGGHRPPDRQGRGFDRALDEMQ